MGFIYRYRAALSLCMIGLIAFSLRFIALIELDGQVWAYHYLAKNILNGYGLKDWGGGPHTVFPPFSAYYFALATKVFNLNILASSRLGNLVLSTLTVFPSFYFARRVFSTPAAYVVALSFAIFPHLVAEGTKAHTDVQLTFFFITGGWIAMVCIQEKQLWTYPVLGLVMGLAYLAKPDGLVFFALFICIVIYGNIHKLSGRFYFKVLTAIVVFAVISLPYIFYISNTIGKFSLTGKQPYVIAAANAVDDGNWMKNYYALNKDKTKRIVEEYGKQSLVRFIIENPHKMAKVYKTGVSRLVRFVSIPLSKSLPSFFLIVGSMVFLLSWRHYSIKNIATLSALILLGLGVFKVLEPSMLGYERTFILLLFVFALTTISLFRTDKTRALAPLILFVPAMMQPVSIIAARYSYSYIVASTTILAGGLVYLFEKHILGDEGRGLSDGKRLWCSIVLIAAMFIYGIYYLDDAMEDLPLPSNEFSTKLANYNTMSGYRYEAGRWIAENLPRGSRIMARNLHITFYADDVETVQLPYGTYDDILHYARHNKVDYVLYSLAEKRDSKALEMLWQGDYDESDFHLIKSLGSGGQKVLIYELLP